MKRIKYTEAKCIGCGICESEAPFIFSMNADTGKAQLLDAEFKNDMAYRILWPDELQVMQSIVTLCSVKAIKIE